MDTNSRTASAWFKETLPGNTSPRQSACLQLSPSQFPPRISPHVSAFCRSSVFENCLRRSLIGIRASDTPVRVSRLTQIGDCDCVFWRYWRKRRWVSPIIRKPSYTPLFAHTAHLHLRFYTCKGCRSWTTKAHVRRDPNALSNTISQRRRKAKDKDQGVLPTEELPRNHFTFR